LFSLKSNDLQVNRKSGGKRCKDALLKEEEEVCRKLVAKNLSSELNLDSVGCLVGFIYPNLSLSPKFRFWPKNMGHCHYKSKLSTDTVQWGCEKAIGVLGY
jgi:hypothetical protein